MVFVPVFLVALVVALVRCRGRLAINQAIHLRGVVLIFVALLVQIIEVYWPGSLSHVERAVLLAISLACVAIVVILNRAYWAIDILGFGLVLNGLVMVLNGGFMPVSPDTLAHIGRLSLAGSLQSGTLVAHSKDVLLLPNQTHLWFFSDIVPIPPPIGVAFSVGDLLIAVGLFALVQQLLSRRPSTGAPSEDRRLACPKSSGSAE